MDAKGKVDDEVASIVLQVMAVAHVAASDSSAVASIIQKIGCMAGAQNNALGWMHANADASYMLH